MKFWFFRWLFFSSRNLIPSYEMSKLLKNVEAGRWMMMMNLCFLVEKKDLVENKEYDKCKNYSLVTGQLTVKISLKMDLPLFVFFCLWNPNVNLGLKGCSNCETFILIKHCPNLDYDKSSTRMWLYMSSLASISWWSLVFWGKK